MAVDRRGRYGSIVFCVAWSFCQQQPQPGHYLVVIGGDGDGGRIPASWRLSQLADEMGGVTGDQVLLEFHRGNFLQLQRAAGDFSGLQYCGRDQADCRDNGVAGEMSVEAAKIPVEGDAASE